MKNYLPRAFATKMSPNYIFNSLNMEVFHLGSIKSFVQIDENRSVNKKGERGYWALGRHVPLKPVAADASCPRYSTCTLELALETKSYICCMELFSWWFVWTKCKIVLQSVKTSRLTFYLEYIWSEIVISLCLWLSARFRWKWRQRYIFKVLMSV